jgi:hypothetical protein
MQSFTFRVGMPHEHLFLGNCFVELTIGLHSARRPDNFVLRYPVCESLRIRLISNFKVGATTRWCSTGEEVSDVFDMVTHFWQPSVLITSRGQPTHGDGYKPRTGASTYNAHSNGFSRLLEENATYDDPLTSGP